MSSFSFLRRYVPRALGAWLALSFTLLSVVLTLAIIMVIEWKANQQVTTSIGFGLAELAMQTSDKLERGMFERYREVRLLSQRRELMDGAPVPQRRAVLDELQASYGYYSWIGVAGLDGRVQVAVRGLLEGADVSKRPWFGNARIGTHAGDVHEALLLARLLPAQREPWRFVDIAFPVMDGAGKMTGVLGAHLSWQWARDVERSVIAGVAARRQVEALVIDSKGRVLLGPADLQGTRLDLASLRAAPGRPAGGYVEERWPDGKSYLVGFARGHGHAQYPGLGWTVLVRQNVHDAYAPVRELREYGLSWGMLLAAVFSLAGVAMAGRITRPLDELARSARRIQNGELGPFTSGKFNYNEVRTLSRTLSALVADLIGQRRQVEQLNATLEQRVDARTRELALALDTVRASEHRIATIIETAQDAFIGVDMDGRIIDWNTTAEAMLGWRRGEALGRLVADLVLPEDQREGARAQLEGFRDTGRFDILDRRIESRMLTRDGREIPVEMTAGLAGTGAGVFFSLFVHDISHRKEVERMKDEFVATVSHELRTPLTAISASLALLADGMAGELPPDAHELIGIARASCDRLMRLIGDVLDIQKIEAGQMEYARDVEPLLPLAGYAVAGMQSMATAAGMTLVCEAGPGGDAVRAAVDRDRITQVLTNLLSNAIKFSDRRDTIVTRVEARDDRALISVIDQGAGIPEAFRGRVFQRFAQADGADSRRKGGTGLGLSICKRIVEEHGGTIRFESVEGKGTTFHVDLPAA